MEFTVDAESPGALDRNKLLDPVFLGEALELAEEVAFASGDAIPPLTMRLQEALSADLLAIGQRAEARALHCRDVNEDILRSVIRSDEAEAFIGESFDRAIGHIGTASILA